MKKIFLREITFTRKNALDVIKNSGDAEEDRN